MATKEEGVGKREGRSKNMISEKVYGGEKKGQELKSLTIVSG